MKESVRIFRFIIVGTLNALITALVIWVLMKGVGCNYLWSNIAGYVAALVNNFFGANTGYSPPGVESLNVRCLFSLSLSVVLTAYSFSPCC